LRRWEELRPELDAYDVELVTVCADTPEEIRKGRAKHGARAVMLSDRALRVTDAYGLRNPGNLSPRGWVDLPIPTTILVDGAGIVRWIDQATDYQIRSHPDRVIDALREALGPGRSARD
jgi:peroxiredoxin